MLYSPFVKIEKSIYVWAAFADPYGQEILKQWNVPTDRYAVMQLLLGYPCEGDSHPEAKPRKAGRIIRN